MNSAQTIAPSTPDEQVAATARQALRGMPESRRTPYALSRAMGGSLQQALGLWDHLGMARPVTPGPKASVKAAAMNVAKAAITKNATPAAPAKPTPSAAAVPKANSSPSAVQGGTARSPSTPTPTDQTLPPPGRGGSGSTSPTSFLTPSRRYSTRAPTPRIRCCWTTSAPAGSTTRSRCSRR